MIYNEMLTVEEILKKLPSRDEEKNKRNDEINKILGEYLESRLDKRKPVVYGRVVNKRPLYDGRYLYEIEILYSVNSDDTLNKWESEDFYQDSALSKVCNVTSFNIAKSDRIALYISEGDYVKFYLVPCTSVSQVYDRKNLYTFNFNELKKVPSISDIEEKQIRYIARILNLDCADGKKVVFPIVSNIEQILSISVKNVLDEKNKVEDEMEEARQKLDKLHDESENLKNEIENLNNEKQKLLNDKAEIKREISDSVKDINFKKKDCLKLEQEVADKKDELQKIEVKSNLCENTYKNLKPVIEAARRYKYLCEENEVSSIQDSSVITLSNNLNDDIANIIKALKEQTGWRYPDYIVRSMLLGVRSKQLIILCGEPGSGKTSFAKAFSKVVGYKETAIISVQSNWMDSSDLLGYYNPQSEKYVPTQFLEELVECNKLALMNTDKLFFICLDEMNLSHIEYYFADFLSALQNDRKIRLYDKNSMTLEYFPAILEIAENIHFIGTINIDDTTKNLSPKVVDRSFFIRIENDDCINERMTDSLREVPYNVLKTRLNAHLKSKLSYRFDNALNNIKIDEDDEKSKTAIVNALVLPKFNDEYEPEDVEEFKALLGEAVVNELNQGDKWYSYWRR